MIKLPRPIGSEGVQGDDEPGGRGPDLETTREIEREPRREQFATGERRRALAARRLAQGMGTAATS